ncbi:MAG: phosphatase [Acholeplasma sp.]|jgi:exopolyphosphatase/guanosine-5'-triphosphate,3'-diphosphate pyrophosphatase|nr:MAG: phosphatase [Acholeplasma sp.]
MVGIIDLGSNTVRLNIYQYKNQDLIPFSTRKETLGLASYVDPYQNLTPEGIQKAIEVVRLFHQMAKQARVKQLFVIATASLRNVKNGMLVKKMIEDATGIDVDLLSGEDEALADFYGVKMTEEFNEGFVIDIGGASTEIVEYADGEIKHAFALPIGSLSAYMRHVEKIIPKKEELNEIKNEVLLHLKHLNIEFGSHEKLYGVGGTLRATKKLNAHFMGELIENQVISRKTVKQIMDKVLSDDKDAIVDVIRLIPERIHTILPGMTILKTIAKVLNVEQIIVENYGVREGYLYQKVILPDLEKAKVYESIS